MRYGAKKIEALIPSEEDPIVICNKCNTYHYESLGSALDRENLQLLHNEGQDHPYKGCGNCLTDAYLMDLD